MIKKLARGGCLPLKWGSTYRGRTACCTVAEESNHILVGPPDIFYHALTNASPVCSSRLGVKAVLECSDFDGCAELSLLETRKGFLSLKSFCFLVFDGCDRAVRGDATLGWNRSCFRTKISRTPCKDGRDLPRCAAPFLQPDLGLDPHCRVYGKPVQGVGKEG